MSTPFRCVLLTLAAAFFTGWATAAEPSSSRFGADTPGGRGGRVLRVTTLDSDGEGSLRWALREKGPRIVVFEVAGVIDLNRKPLSISEPRVTVAGQTAPSPGITLIRGGIAIGAHDVILQHLHVRPGDAGRPRRSGWEPDGITTVGAEAHDVLIDHCSVTWAVDENISVSGPRLEGPQATSRRVTIRNCIIAEGLNDSSHSKGPHSKGSLVHDCCQEIAVVGNLYAHNTQRNPYFKAHATGAIVNNVIYDPGSAAVQLGYSLSEWSAAELRPVPPRVSVVGNVYLQGESTRLKLAMVGRTGDAYLDDNLALDAAGRPAPLTAGDIAVLAEKPAWPAGLEAIPSSEVIDYVVRHAGARPKDRDPIDRRIVQDLLDRRGRIIDSQDQVGGYPEIAPVRRGLDVPETDVDAWLARFTAEVE